MRRHRYLSEHSGIAGSPVRLQRSKLQRRRRSIVQVHAPARRRSGSLLLLGRHAGRINQDIPFVQSFSWESRRHFIVIIIRRHAGHRRRIGLGRQKSLGSTLARFTLRFLAQRRRRCCFRRRNAVGWRHVGERVQGSGATRPEKIFFSPALRSGLPPHVLVGPDGLCKCFHSAAPTRLDLE